MMTDPQDDNKQRIHDRLQTIARSGGNGDENHEASPEPMAGFDSPRQEAAYWRGRFEKGRERLAKLWLTYKDLEAERDLWKEKAIKAEQETPPSTEPILEERIPTEEAVDTVQTDQEEPSDPVGQRLEVEAVEPVEETLESPNDRSSDEAVDTDEAAPEPETDSDAMLPNDPFGDIHPVDDVEGIGEVYSQRLEEAGLFDTRRLWAADAGDAADAAEVSQGMVERWQAQAELMALNGVGPQYAELLVRSGITTIDELARQDAENLQTQLNDKEDSLNVSIQGNPPTERRVQRWIMQARDHPA